MMRLGNKVKFFIPFPLYRIERITLPKSRSGLIWARFFDAGKCRVKITPFKPY